MRTPGVALLVAVLLSGAGCLALISFDQPPETGEQCMDDLDNDGNGLTDCEEQACVASCQPQVRCGDGSVLPGIEECDDGNETPNDGCEPVICRYSCGSGLVADRRGYDPATGHCYLGFAIPRDARSANDACMAFGAYLAVPDSASEDVLIRSAAPDSASLGLADNFPGTNYEFHQITGDRGTEYLNFSPGQPDEPLDQMMICVSYDGPATTWQDFDCFLPRAYVCELTRKPCGDDVQQPPEGCDDGNIDANDGCAANCVDEDECGLGLDNCSVDADCTNQPWTRFGPGFTCECHAGFIGDGVTCIPS